MRDNQENRGIQIAILYTEYYPLGSFSFYDIYIAPFASSIGPNLQSCASPGLYFAVSTDVDISNSLTMLFNAAVQGSVRFAPVQLIHQPTVTTANTGDGSRCNQQIAGAWKYG